MNVRRSEQNGLHSLAVYECPIEVLAELARAAAVDVTVENVSPVRAADRWFEAVHTIDPRRAAGNHRIRNARFDVALTNAEFLDLMPFWNEHGVYAVFTVRSPIAFQSSSLEAPARYRALANFGFVLEFGLGAADPWSRIVSPRVDLIDLAERCAQGLRRADVPRV